MSNTVLLSLAALIAVGIIGIGSFYLLSPQKMVGSFGLKLPAADADTRNWLRLKGVRDITSGLVVMTLMLTTNPRTVGIAMMVFAVTAFGDMSVVLASGGSKSAAFSVHGVTCVALLILGLFLQHVL